MPLALLPPPQDATSVKAARPAIEGMEKESRKTPPPMASLCARALSARQQAVLIAYRESDRTARITNNVDVAEAAIALTIKATSLVRGLAQTPGTRRPQQISRDGEDSGQAGDQERLG